VYNNDSISIEAYSIAIPIAEIKRYFCVTFFATREEAARKARLKNNAPICFVALKAKTLTTPKSTGDETARD